MTVKGTAAVRVNPGVDKLVTVLAELTSDGQRFTGGSTKKLDAEEKKVATGHLKFGIAAAVLEKPTLSIRVTVTVEDNP